MNTRRIDQLDSDELIFVHRGNEYKLNRQSFWKISTKARTLLRNPKSRYEFSPEDTEANVKFLMAICNKSPIQLPDPATSHKLVAFLKNWGCSYGIEELERQIIATKNPVTIYAYFKSNIEEFGSFVHYIRVHFPDFIEIFEKEKPQMHIFQKVFSLNDIQAKTRANNVDFEYLKSVIEQYRDSQTRLDQSNRLIFENEKKSDEIKKQILRFASKEASIEAEKKSIDSENLELEKQISKIRTKKAELLKKKKTLQNTLETERARLDKYLIGNAELDQRKSILEVQIKNCLK